MANTLITPDMVSKEALRILSNNLPFCKSINREYEGEFAQEGNKYGDTFDVRVPNNFTVTKERAINVQDVPEETTPVTVDKEYHVAFEMTSKELTLDIDMFSNRYIKPAVINLANAVERDVIAEAYQRTYNQAGTYGVEMSSFQHSIAPGTILTEELALMSDRYILVSPVAMANVSNSLHGNFHKDTEVSKMFLDGYFGRMAGFDWLQSAVMPTHVNGTRTGAGADVNTSTGIVSGSGNIAMTGLTANQTLKAGDLFTIEGVYPVNYQTKERYGTDTDLQKFVVQSDHTLTATDSIDVLPVPVTSGPRQNITIVGAGASKTVTWLSATASQRSRINLAYHKDAFTLVMPPKAVPDGATWASMASEDGFGVRVIKDFDIRNDTDVCRIDVMWGFDKLYNQHACRVNG